MRRSAVLRSATLAGLLLLSIPGPLGACAFHTTLPEATVSDQIAAAVEVIAARPSRDDPFRFKPIAVLKGASSQSGPPDLVDSATRHRLARDPDDAVLYARMADGTWTRLLLLDAATRPVVDRMLVRAAVWTTPQGAVERRDLFAGLLRHPDERLRRLALGELDALPYSVLRGGTYAIPADDLLRDIADIQDMPFAPIRILLLGIDGGSDAQDAISRRLASMASTGIDTNLGAWITAALEGGASKGIAEVERLFLASPGRLTERQLTEIVRALSVQSAEGNPAIRTSLDGAIRRLVSLRPDAAPLIAQAFAAASDYSQVPLIRDLVVARAFDSRSDLMVATAYIARSRSAAPGASWRTTGKLQEGPALP
jgi:hypothetical protein